MESEELRLDEFFQRLREIQKKERGLSGLADVGDNFYRDVHTYLNKLIKEIGDNPLSFYSYMHRDARRIAAEICERREHKIINSVLLNIQRSRRLFNENSPNNEADSLPLSPQNMTLEEENMYYSVYKSFLKYREKIFSQEKFESPLQVEKESHEDIEPEIRSDLKEKKNKRVPSGIDHDIDSYQAYETVEHIMFGQSEILKAVENHGARTPGMQKTKGFLKHQNSENFESVQDPKIGDFDGFCGPQRNKNNQIKTLIVLEELPSIMGVDREIYGPLLPQDIVSMPEANAQIIIKNKKGRFIKKHEKIAYK